MEPLNKISVLDKGYVAEISVSFSQKKLKEIEQQFYAGAIYKDLATLSDLTLNIKCPLFYHIYLSRFNFNFLQVRNTKELELIIELYQPDETEIKCPELEVSREVKEDMIRTGEALIVNRWAYQKDGCDNFISQGLIPISAYTNLIVKGSLEEWLKLINMKSGPSPVQAYRKVIEGIILANWPDMKSYTRE